MLNKLPQPLNSAHTTNEFMSIPLLAMKLMDVIDDEHLVYSHNYICSQSRSRIIPCMHAYSVYSLGAVLERGSDTL